MIITWQKSLFNSFFRRGRDEQGNIYYHVTEKNHKKEQYICILSETGILGYGSTAVSALSWATTNEYRSQTLNKKEN